MAVASLSSSGSTTWHLVLPRSKRPWLAAQEDNLAKEVREVQAEHPAYMEGRQVNFSQARNATIKIPPQSLAPQVRGG